MSARGGVSSRGALLGAAAAAAIMLAAAAVTGHLGWPLGLGALVGLLAAALLDRAARRRAGAAPPKAGRESGPSTAEILLGAVPDPVILVGRRGVVVEANEAARTLLPGLRQGRPLSFGLRAPDVLDGVEAVLRTGQPLVVEYHRRGPTALVFEVQVSPRGGAAPDGDGEAPEVVLAFRDVTAALRLERMRTDFIANASHELRTPLASLIGFIETLQGPARDDAAARARFLGIMRGQALRMKRLIDDLLSLSRIELDEHVQPAGEADLSQIARHIIDGLQPLARERSVTFALTGVDEPRPVRGDRDELLRLVENLVENAIKYGRPGGQVELWVERRPGQGGLGEVELGVRDDGPGIAPEHLPRLTERFYRVDPAESRERGGTGLGLAIVKHIVARHRGRLAIDSRPGEGAVFRVWLPSARV